jgi:hypothetical protein
MTRRIWENICLNQEAMKPGKGKPKFIPGFLVSRLGYLNCVGSFIAGPLIGAQYGIQIRVRNVGVPVHDGRDRLPDSRE